MNYLMKKRLALMKNRKFRGYIKTASGNPLTLSDCVENGLINLKISGNSVQDGTPAPQNPIDVQSVGDKTNNLFDITKIQHDKITVSGNTMYVYQNGAKITQFSPEQFLEMTGLKPGDEILTSLNKSIIKASSSPGVWGRLVFLGKNSNKSFLLCDYRTDMLISTIPENFSSETYGNLVVYGANLDDNDESLIEIKDIVITSNTDNRFYQSEDIENPQSTITIEQENGIYTLNGTNSSDEAIVLSQDMDFKIPVRNEYVLVAEVLSGETNVSSGNVYIKINNDRGLNFPVNNRIEGFSNILTKTPASVSIAFSEGTSATFNNVKLKVSVIEYKRLPYEPYGYKIPIKINAEDTADIYLDEPLRKCGEYADYVDYKNKKVIRQIGKYYIPSGQHFDGGSVTDKGLYRYFFASDPFMIAGSKLPGYGNFLQNLEQSWPLWEDETLHFGQVNGQIYIILNNHYENDIDIYNYLSNNGANDIYVIYILREPIEEDINTEKIQIKQGTNIISAETVLEPSNMEASYYSDIQED